MSELGTVAELANRVGGRVIGDGAVGIDTIAAIDDVGPGALTFATDERYLRTALASRAAAVLVAEALVDASATYAKPLLAVASPRIALATLLESLGPQRPRGRVPGSECRRRSIGSDRIGRVPRSARDGRG